jgi:hypothetical protein
MATISRPPSGKYRAKTRRSGYPTISKAFLSKAAAQSWARKTESEVERSVYLDLSDAGALRFSDVLPRCSEQAAGRMRAEYSPQSTAMIFMIRFLPRNESSRENRAKQVDAGEAGELGCEHSGL